MASLFCLTGIQSQPHHPSDIGQEEGGSGDDVTEAWGSGAISVSVTHRIAYTDSINTTKYTSGYDFGEIFASCRFQAGQGGSYDWVDTTSKTTSTGSRASSGSKSNTWGNKSTKLD